MNLKEKDFFHEPDRKNLSPLIFWGCVIAVMAAFFWGIGSTYNTWLQKQIETDPFLQVTNRQISLFLWQFPEYMRINTKEKTGYLPGFLHEKRVCIAPDMAEKLVAAPPEVLFMYHTWNRLLKEDILFDGTIPTEEFRRFLNSCEEWKPGNWDNAPKEYSQLVASLSAKGLPIKELPKEVQIAFQGWRNYFLEGELINKQKIHYGEIKKFLNKSPHYARNYWKNIYPNYLKTPFQNHSDDEIIPNNELEPFLKVAFFNYQQVLPQSH